MDREALVALTAEIVASHVANNAVAIGDLPAILASVHTALAGLSAEPGAPAEPKSPRVSIKASVRRDHLICLACGRKQKMLKRHLGTAHGMIPEEYRRDYGLPATYPMAAPAYSAMRREMALSIGLGRKNRPSARSRS